MKPPRPILILTIIFFGALFFLVESLGSCPDCYLDHKAMKSHGTSDNGRPIVRVNLTGSWDTSPGQSDPRMFSAVRDAVADWNRAVDPATGRGAFYHLDFSSATQNADDRDVNIRIVKAPQGYAGRAYITGPAGGPYNVNIPANSPDKCVSAAALLEVVKHELGHPMGLAHKEKGFGKCRGDEDSIMNAPSRQDAPCIELFRKIEPRDVQVTNDVDNPSYRQGNCKSTGQGKGAADLITPTPTPTPSGGGDQGCYTMQDFDSYYVGEGCWHDYWTVIVVCNGYLVHFSQMDLDVSCY